MELLIFVAFIVVYALLVVGHKECNPRAYKLFLFGFLISVLYASVYSFTPDVALLFILLLTSLAILTQYFHMRAVEAGRSKPMKKLVNVEVKPEEALLKEKAGNKTAKRRAARRR